MTDSQGRLSFQYQGTRSGHDSIAVTHDGDDSFMEQGAARVTWDGPDVVIPGFIPPMLRTKGGRTFFVTEWTQNIGTFPADPSTTQYFLSTTNPVDPTKARLVGKRTVPALAPGERSAVRQQSFTIPDDLPEGLYYLGACADTADTVTEANEQNNCSFHQIPQNVIIFTPSTSRKQAPQ